jgi:hypothetical protein
VIRYDGSIDGGFRAGHRYLDQMGEPPRDRHGLEYQYGLRYQPRSGRPARPGARGRPAEPGRPPGPPRPPRPGRPARWPRWLLAGSGLFASAIVAGSVIADRTAPTTPRRAPLVAAAARPGTGADAGAAAGLVGDVAVTGCARAVGAPATAEVTLTNHGPGPADYVVTVILAGRGGNVVGTVNVIAHDLAPGQSTRPRQVSVGRLVPTGGLVCQAGSLTRRPTGLI